MTTGTLVRRSVVSALIVALFLTYAQISARRAQVWQSDVALWEDAALSAPCVIRPHLELAQAYAAADNVPAMLREWNRVSALQTAIPCD